MNAYMWADALAIARVADLSGDGTTAGAYRAKASVIKHNLQNQLWDPKRQFFFHMFQRDEEADGFLVKARTLTHQTGRHAGSAFGREFDSLADIISFGIAPALLVFKIVLAELPARLGWMIGFVYLVCGAMRLARFNTLAVQPSTTPRSKDFSGFPIPAAAGLVASVTLLLLKYYESDRVIGNFKYALAALLLFLSFMMFSQVSYPSFKTLDWRSQRPIPRLLLIVAALALIVQTYQYSLAVLFCGYLLYGFIRPKLSRRLRSEIEEEKIRSIL